jgi:hypothetical protein
MSSRAEAVKRRQAIVLDWAGTWNRGALAMMLAGVIGAVLMALLSRPLLDHQPLYDELLHVLSARGLNATGEPVIADGIYERAELYTHLVAFALRTVGDTLVAARLPAWLAAIALVVLTAAWVTRRAGFIAGASAGLLLAINPWTLELAVFARFYTLHALTAMIMFVSLYESFARGRRPEVRGLFLLAAGAAAGVAWHLQVTTLVALGAAGAGVIAVLLLDYHELALRFVRKRPVLALGGVALALALGSLMVFQLGLVDRLGTTPLWAEATANSREYYNSVLSRDLPLLWPLIPFAFLAGLFVDRRLAVFCIVAAVAAILVHSIAAQKATRYIFYLLPLLCVLWGCAIAKSVQLLNVLAARFTPAMARYATVFGVALIGLMVMNSTEGRRAARLLAGRDGAEVLSYANEADWSTAVARLTSLRNGSVPTIASNGMKALYFIGHYDFELNASIVGETDTGKEFGIDPRTGRPVLSRPESLEQLLRANPRALVIVENEKLRRRVGVAAEVVDLLDARCARAELPREGGIVAWSCDAPAVASDPAPLAHR